MPYIQATTTTTKPDQMPEFLNRARSAHNEDRNTP